jgi:glycosyltransferase involved in cell wall biosynthesis
MNILIASGVPKRREGGVAAIVYNVGGELEKLGHQVTYVFLDDLMTTSEGASRFGEAKFAFRLARYIAQNRTRFSVVNLHAPTGFVYGIRRRWLGRRSDPPYVMTLHGLEERRVHAMKREAKKGRARNFGWKNRLWHSVYHAPRFRWSIRTADGAHAYGRDVATILQLKYDLDAERVAYIPNGVDRRFFVPRAYETDGGLRLLYAGTWLEQRGIFYLREALRKAAPRVPRLTMTFAGPGVPSEEILRFFGGELAPRIFVREAVPAERMQELYAEHDVFVFPSLVEGLPNVLMEAMASGMPVITTETCGMTDIVENQFNGVLIPPADAAALEDAILRLANCEELRRKLGTAAREAMQRFTWERTAKMVGALFQRTLIQAGADRPSIAARRTPE